MLKTIYYLLILSGISILVLGWKMLDRKMFLLLGLLIVAFFTERIDDIFSPPYIPGMDRPTKGVFIYIHHIYRVIELSLLSMYYYFLFDLKRNKQIVLAGTLLFFIYFFYDFACHSENFNSKKRVDLLVEGLFLTVYSVLFLIELYQREKPVIVKRYAHFWIVIANLIFFSASSFFNGYIDYLLTNRMLVYIKLSLIMVVLNYMLYSFYIIGFLCHLQAKKLA